MFTALNTTRRLACLRSVWALAVLASLLSGCRTARDNQIEILERELRTQEDYIYELEDYVIQYSEKLRSMRYAQAIPIETKTKSRSSIVKKSSPDGGPELRSDGSRTDDLDEERNEPEIQETDPVEEFNLDDFEPPPLNIEEPVGGIQVSTTDSLAQLDQQRSAEPTDTEELYLPSPVDYPSEEQDSESEETDSLRQVTLHDDLFEDQDLVPADYEVIVDDFNSTNAGPSPERILVKQLFRDDESGTPDRLLAVVEGLDEEDQPIEFTGKVSLMVMVADAKRPFRLKRWDFNSEDVSEAWQSSHLGDGIHLELPLEETKLPNVPLELWVRLVDSQKSKLLTQKSFRRSQLAGLEVETGAKELQPNDQVQLAATAKQKSPPKTKDESIDSGWRSTTRSTLPEATGFATSLRKAGGWTAQSNSTANSDSKSSSTKSRGKGPVWTAGRPRTSSTTSR